MLEQNALTDPIVRAMDTAEAMIASRVALEDLSRAAGLSRFHFHRIFTERVGETPASFVERLRLERAALLLLADNLSITELAWDMGFQNPETFARRFRARFGVSARDYRRHQLELFSRLNVSPGQDPGGQGSEIFVRPMPDTDIAFQRALGDEDRFGFDHSASPSLEVSGPSALFFRRTWDWPGITAPERIRTDRGVRVGEGVSVPGYCRGKLQRDLHAVITVDRPTPVSNEVYQRLFIWSLAGEYRLAPGPLIELYEGQEVLVCQPVRKNIGGAGWFRSSRSKSIAR